MKKTLSILLAATTLLACTKSEVTYTQPQEIGFTPISNSITKSALDVTSGPGSLPTGQGMGIWAFWDTDATAGTVSDFTAYSETYLNNADFVYKSVTTTDNQPVQAWGGNGVAYPWPLNGALVFAGYNKPATGETCTFGTTPTYDLTTNTMVFGNYTQSSTTSDTFDLCWFERTASSYNYKTTGEAVPVTLSHALTWITLQVKGEGLPVTSNWKVTDITLNDIAVNGTGTCTNNGTNQAAWECSTFNTDVTIYNNTTGQTITGTATDIENTAKGTVVIPQLPTTITITYTYPVGDASNTQNWKTGTATADLTLDGTDTKSTKWQSGMHYTYTISFKSNEILVAPSYSDWAEATSSTITVE